MFSYNWRDTRFFVQAVASFPKILCQGLGRSARIIFLLSILPSDYGMASSTPLRPRGTNEEQQADSVDLNHGLQFLGPTVIPACPVAEVTATRKGDDHGSDDVWLPLSPSTPHPSNETSASVTGGGIYTPARSTFSCDDDDRHGVMTMRPAEACNVLCVTIADFAREHPSYPVFVHSLLHRSSFSPPLALPPASASKSTNTVTLRRRAEDTIASGASGDLVDARVSGGVRTAPEAFFPIGGAVSDFDLRTATSIASSSSSRPRVVSSQHRNEEEIVVRQSSVAAADDDRIFVAADDGREASVAVGTTGFSETVNNNNHDGAQGLSVVTNGKITDSGDSTTSGDCHQGINSPTFNANGILAPVASTAPAVSGVLGNGMAAMGEKALGVLVMKAAKELGGQEAAAMLWSHRPQ